MDPLNIKAIRNCFIASPSYNDPIYTGPAVVAPSTNRLHLTKFDRQLRDTLRGRVLSAKERVCGNRPRQDSNDRTHVNVLPEALHHDRIDLLDRHRGTGVTGRAQLSVGPSL
jgi:hypothetical protein